MSKNDDVEIRAIDAWGDDELAEFTAMMARRSRDTPWSGRWEISEAYFRWKFTENPAGPALCVGAWRGGTLLGSLALSRLNFRVGGRLATGGEICDAYIDESLRGQGVFRRIVKALANRVRSEGIDLPFAVPNSDAHKSFIASGEYLPAPRAERMVCVLPLTPSHFAPKWASASRYVVDPLWRGLLRGLARHVERPTWTDVDYIRRADQWGDLKDLAALADLDVMYRIARHPQSSFYRMACWPAEDGAGAWAIVKETEHEGRRFLMIGTLKAHTRARYRAALCSLVQDSIREGRDAVVIWVHPDDLAKVIRPATPFIPVQHKKIVFVKTPGTEAVHASNGRVEIDLIHTDKI